MLGFLYLLCSIKRSMCICGLQVYIETFIFVFHLKKKYEEKLMSATLIQVRAFDLFLFFFYHVAVS